MLIPKLIRITKEQNILVKKNAKKLKDSQGKKLSESAYIRLLIEGGHKTS